VQPWLLLLLLLLLLLSFHVQGIHTHTHKGAPTATYNAGGHLKHLPLQQPTAHSHNTFPHSFASGGP
jgi:hypothetical protein